MRSKINKLITACSIHPYTRTTFPRSVDKVTHRRTTSINNQLDLPSISLSSKKREHEIRGGGGGEEEKDRPPTLLLLLDSLEIISPFSTRGDRPQGHSRINDSHRPRNRATTHPIPSFYPRDRHIPPPCTQAAVVARYIISQLGSHFGRPRRAESRVYFEGGSRVHRVQWRACSRNCLHGTRCPPRKIGRVNAGNSTRFSTSSGIAVRSVKW